MPSNVTLKLDDALLKQARKAAVDDDASLSAWVAALIAETLRKRNRHRAARRRAVAALDTDLHLSPGRPRRDELHER